MLIIWIVVYTWQVSKFQNSILNSITVCILYKPACMASIWYINYIPQVTWRLLLQISTGYALDFILEFYVCKHTFFVMYNPMELTRIYSKFFCFYENSKEMLQSNFCFCWTAIKCVPSTVLNVPVHCCIFSHVQTMWLSKRNVLHRKASVITWRLKLKPCKWVQYFISFTKE